MSYVAEELIERARVSLQEIGYRDDLLFRNYPFADFFSSTYSVREVPLAAFVQYPPSYRSSGIGILSANGDYPVMENYVSLGAPYLFVVQSSKDRVDLWRVQSSIPEHFDTIDANNIDEVIRERDRYWSPTSILRAKAIGSVPQTPQLDFYDLGFWPVLEHEVHSKLDGLFQKTLAQAVDLHREQSKREFNEDEYRGLFRLVFRLVAAKLLGDRRYPGEWTQYDVKDVLRKVDNFYFKGTEPEKLSLNLAVMQGVWDEIRTGFHLQNLSLEALAYVYENTFVTKETRRRFGTHATRAQVAEFIVQQVEFEEIADPNERTVFEPFAGHAPFLTASLSRLRSLLPASISATERHKYFTRMLSGIEIDSFAREVARYSLILADYPNPDGWNIKVADAFDSQHFVPLLKQANIVLCNPPFGDFTKSERAIYGKSIQIPNKGGETLLRVLELPPRMLGFILPRTFTDGRSYKLVRRRLAEEYGSISIIALPDNAFSHSEAETVIVIAKDRHNRERRHWKNVYVARKDYEHFLRTGRASWEYEEFHPEEPNKDPVLWKNPLEERLRGYLAAHQKLGEVANISRGIEYEGSVESHTSDTPQLGYSAGIQRVANTLTPYLIRHYQYLDVAPGNMRTNAHLLPWKQPKVVVNAARISRGPWRVVAGIDKKGLVCSQRFHGIWAKDGFPLAIIAGVVNGPLANALISSSARSRDNLVKDLKSIPLPQLSEEDATSIISLVESYLNLAIRHHEREVEEQHMLMLQIDIIILRGYQLPKSLLSDLFDYIGSYERPRIGMSFLDQLRIRHALLVDEKFAHGLSPVEMRELETINQFLEAAEASYYEPVKQYLTTLHAKLLSNIQD